MGNKILIIAIVALSGCRSPDTSERKETFLEKDIKARVQEADSYFETGDYQTAFEKYQKALIDFRIIILRTEDKLELNTFVLDTLEINNKMEVARIGVLMR